MSTIYRPAPMSPLAEREREALMLYGQGLDYVSIAARMTVSTHTVKNQLESCRKKLKVKTSKAAYFKLVKMEKKAGG